MNTRTLLRLAATAAATLATLLPAAHASGWEFAPSMPAPKARTFATKLDGALYMVGGSPWRNGTDQDGSVFRFANGVWTEAATLEGLGPAVGQGGGVDALGRILVFGGLIEGSGDLAESRWYDPLNGTDGTPASASIFNPPQNFGLAVDAQQRIYRIAGGCDECNNNQTICSRYDGLLDAWQQVAWVPWARSSVATADDGQGHIWGFGGYTSVGAWRIVDTIRYTVATDTWQTLGSVFLPVPTSDANAVLGADGKLYVIGGRIDPTGAITSTVYVLDQSGPEPKLLTGPSLAIARYDCGVVLGDDDYIYVIGGTTDAGPTATVERLYTGAAPSAWTDLGGAKPGSNGTPTLAGSGPLTGGSANQVALGSAAPSSPAHLVLGLTLLGVPFKGGTLVPDPVEIVSLSTSAAGTLSVPFTWPVGIPAGAAVYLQFWIEDAGASHALAASNGLKGVAN